VCVAVRVVVGVDEFDGVGGLRVLEGRRGLKGVGREVVDVVDALDGQGGSSHRHLAEEGTGRERRAGSRLARRRKVGLCNLTKGSAWETEKWVRASQEGTQPGRHARQG
jgi:hypothetical protein